jgi:hypothetical protein
MLLMGALMSSAATGISTVFIADDSGRPGGGDRTGNYLDWPVEPQPQSLELLRAGQIGKGGRRTTNSRRSAGRGTESHNRCLSVA